MSALGIAIEKVKAFEGCKLKAYKDMVGVLTIGYGETKGVTPGMEWTHVQAERALRTRLIEFMGGALVACRALKDMPDECLAACTSLAYNIGLGAFAKSTVCRKINAGDLAGAADAFLMWNKGGEPLREIKGLTNRRESEKKLFLLGVAKL